MNERTAVLAPPVRLPPLPSALRRVVRAVEDPAATVDSVGAELQEVPRLAQLVRDLAVAAGAPAAAPDSSLRHALLTCGLGRVKSLALVEALAKLANAADGTDLALRRRLWTHSIETALAARWIVERVGLLGSEEAFVSGLTHDAGHFALLQEFGRDYAEIFDEHGEPPSAGREQALFGIAHTAAGAAVLRQWRLPSQYVECAARHHDEEVEDSPHAGLIALVSVADRVHDRAVDFAADAALRIVGVGPRVMEDFWAELTHSAGKERDILITALGR